MTQLANYLGPHGFGCYEVDWTQGPPSRRVEGRADLTIVPGFVDLHIHGAFGIDFMEASSGEMVALCDLLANAGYEAFLPTTVTTSASDVLRALGNLPEHPMIEGFHLEGPFISSKHPGAQPPEFIANPGDSDWNAVLDDSRLRIVTLAPEVEGCLDLARRLASRGVIVSLGHTDATLEQCLEGKRAGARHLTHTFNAMRPLHHREPGTVGFGLTEDDVACELIYDRVHVSREAAEILVRCKGPDGVLAVSDSSKATGLPVGTEIDLWGHACRVEEGSVRIAATGVLAGSTITLLDAYRNLASDFGPELAIRACCLNPRRALGLVEPKVFNEFDRSLELTERRSIA